MKQCINKIISFFQEPRYLALAIMSWSALSLAMAFTAEYGFGLKPCILCLYQRAPYAINIILGLLAFFISSRCKKTTTAILFLSAVIFSIGAMIAAHHVGVEQHWWENMLASCSADNSFLNATIEQLRNMITKTDIVPCDKPAFVLFGISMAGYNFLVSSAISIGIVFLLLKKKK